MSSSKRAKPQPVRPTFADVAHLIAPEIGPPWLPALLEWWAQGIRYDILADGFRPTTLQMAQRLSEFQDAVAVIQRYLEDPFVRDFIEPSGTNRKIRISIPDLKDITQRIEKARSSAILIGKDGKTKRGKAKPASDNVFDPKTHCAARVLELWLFLNEIEPGIKSRSAAAVAQAYWLACGGWSEGYGDPLNGWKHHFKIAKENAGSVGLKRLIWRRDLKQCQRRGGPPWYVGTYFPIPMIETRSTFGA